MAVFLADFFEEKKVDVKKMCFFRMLMGWFNSDLLGFNGDWMVIEWMIEWIWFQIDFLYGISYDCIIFQDDMGITWDNHIYIWDNHGYQGGTPANRVVFT